MGTGFAALRHRRDPRTVGQRAITSTASRAPASDAELNGAGRDRCGTAGITGIHSAPGAAAEWIAVPRYIDEGEITPG